jgi:hypothetical protein
MISRAAAAEIVQAFLSRPDPARNEPLRFVITRIDERPSSWVVYYDSETHMKSKGPVDQSAGNRVVLVSKMTAALTEFGASVPTDEELAKAEAKLGSMRGLGERPNSPRG